MAISEKILKAPPSTGFTGDPRDHFGTALYTGTGSSHAVNGGKFDACADFAHASAHFDIVSPISIASNTDFTYSFWLNFPTVPGTSGFLFGIFGGSTNGVYGPMNLNFYGNSDGTAHSVERYFNNTQYYSDAYQTEAKFTYSANTWYHVALVYTASSSTAQVYHNGSATGSSYVLDTTYSVSSLSSYHCVGMYNPGYYTGSYGFWGKMDQFRIYDSALSSTEVTALYNESYDDSFKLNFPSGKTAKSLYRLNGDITDVSGNYDGSGSTSMAFKYGVNFKPDWVWITQRNATEARFLQDSNRGSTKTLYSSGNYAEVTETQGVTSFDSGGFTLGTYSGMNGSSDTYAAWCWKVNGGTTASDSTGDITSTVQVNNTAGISIVTWTTNGNNAARVGHGLTTTPTAILIKNRSASGSWHFMTTAIDGSFDDLILDGTGTKSDSSLAAPTSTTFASESGAASNTRVAYCLHDVEGYQKISKYTGNGSANGPLVETGFRVGWVMIKRTDASGESWIIFDDARNISNPRNSQLRANETAAEYSGSDKVNFYSDGFQPLTNWDGYNASGGTYLYWAIAAPLETTTPVLADSFNIKTWTGNGTYPPDADGSDDITINTDFAPDFVWGKVRNDNISHILIDSVRGDNKQLSTNSTDAQDIRDPDTKPNAYKFFSDGFSANAWGNLNNAKDYVGYIWKASGSTEILTAGSLNSLASINDKAGFSIVKYTGNATSGATVAHGLSAAPQFIMIKNMDRDGYGWLVYHASRGATKYLVMNTNAGESTQTSIFNDTAPTSTVFTLGSDTFGNYSGDNYIAYCWRPISGFSKFGSYDGNSASDGSGTTQSITTGFQPDLVIIKRYDGTENWYMQDSARGSTKQFYANLNDDEDTETNGVQSFDSTGFTLGGYNGINNQGESFIYMAFKAN